MRPETYQKILEKILITCEGTINFIDDILIFGQDEHDWLKYTLRILEKTTSC